MLRLASFAVFLLAIAPLEAAEPAAPRYQFVPGQELAYVSTTADSCSELTLYVIRANEDGSFRMLLHEKDVVSKSAEGKDPTTKVLRESLSTFDVFPDGRAVQSDRLNFPWNVLPQLPMDSEELNRGWSWKSGYNKLTAKPVNSERGYRFEVTREIAWDAIYPWSGNWKWVFTFDPDRGLISTTETISPAKGNDPPRTTTMELRGTKAADPALNEQLRAQERGYFDSLAAYNRAMAASATAGAEEAPKQQAAALAAFKEANRSLTHPVLKRDRETTAANQDGMAKFLLDNSARRARLIGKPAADFETEDFDGHPVKLSDLKGKVVALDFWYKGCGYCLLAMPQINALVKELAGESVVIIGVNIDRKEEEAREVIQKMGLKYPTVKGAGLPEKFELPAYPAFVLIDREGVVRDLHFGYSPELQSTLGKKIKELLGKEEGEAGRKP